MHLLFKKGDKNIILMSHDILVWFHNARSASKKSYKEYVSKSRERDTLILQETLGYYETTFKFLIFLLICQMALMVPAAMASFVRKEALERLKRQFPPIPGPPQPIPGPPGGDHGPFPIPGPPNWG